MIFSPLLARAARLRLLTAAGLAATALVAGCGSSSGGGTSPSAQLSSSAAGTGSTAAEPSAPQTSAGASSAAPSTSAAPSSAPSGGSVTVDGVAVTVDAAAAAKVPTALKSKGTLTVAADASYAPNEFIDPDGKTVIGMDPDLAKALGATLGLKVTIVDAGFDGILPGLASGKYDLGMSSFTDTKAREKVVDFVTYFSAGTAFFIKTGGSTIDTLADLCGHTVAVETGTTQADDATAQSRACTKGGKKPVTVQAYPKQDGANLALSSGRAEVSMADSPVAAYQVTQSRGQFQLTGKSYGTAPYGIAVPKGNGFAAPVLLALKDLIADGAYTKILTTWNIESGAITSPVVDGAQS